MQHLIDSKTTLEVSLEGSDLIQRARDKFANDKPWPSDSTKPVYFFYKLNKFLDQAGNGHLLSNSQVARDWCSFMMKQLPEHIKVGIKAMARVYRDIYRKPEAFEAAVVETRSHFVGALAVLRLTGQGEKNIWKTIVDALKKNGSNEEAKSAQSEGGSSNNSRDIGHPDAHLLKLRSYIPCVGCGEKYRFTAKRNPKDT